MVGGERGSGVGSFVCIIDDDNDWRRIERKHRGGAGGIRPTQVAKERGTI